MHALAGRSLLVTRAAQDARAWKESIEAIGARALVLPCIAVEPRTDPETRERVLALESHADVWAFTSAKGVAAFARLLDHRRLAQIQSTRSQASTPSDATGRFPTIAAVGPRTAQACRDAFGRADVVADGSGAAELARALIAMGATQKARDVLYPTSDLAGSDLEHGFHSSSWTVHRVAVYSTRPLLQPAFEIDLHTTPIDAVLVASPSALEGLVVRARHVREALLVAAGATTAQGARAAGFQRVIAAPASDLGSILETCAKALESPLLSLARSTLESSS